MAGDRRHGTDAILPNSRQWTFHNAKGNPYVLQVAWPLGWKSSTESNGEQVPVFWVLDSNAYFFSVAEAVRRAAVHPGSISGIVIGVGYPPTSPFPFYGQRNWDLTPPSPKYVPLEDKDGNKFTPQPGGANEFLDFIVNDATKFLFEEAEAGLDRKTVKEHVLVGHSYGGLCTLHALFSGYQTFDTFVAVSPSIFWNDSFILTEQDRFLAQTDATTTQKKPRLFISYGHYEQVPHRLPDWTDEENEKWQKHAQSWNTAGHAEALAQKMTESGRFENVRLKSYPEEDHLSVAICGMNWGISCVLNTHRFK
ncbi:hypothetical protein B0A52_02240 [Exophiala mesophila]|uniref:AB hydrolase-1 domain-containing protein n=1 Tax=Exophiala mesophila TaxID=212818 RepID=A0A438NBF9_EXOME|nr:hypothetical protein B0A52_02240 [Exophiala mesophila]